MVDLENITDKAKKASTVILSVGLGASAVAGLSVLDDLQDKDTPNDINDATEDADTEEISDQINQNKNKLDSIADSSSSGNVDYTRFGC